MYLKLKCVKCDVGVILVCKCILMFLFALMMIWICTAELLPFSKQ